MATRRRLDPSSAINNLADFLATARGFLSTFVVLIIGIAIGALLHFNDAFMLGFNLALSVVAIVISGIILVSGARSEAALQVKLDRLIEASKASNATIGIEHKAVAEIEEERRRAEEEGAAALDQHIEQEVTEEVTEQLDERGVGTRP